MLTKADKLKRGPAGNTVLQVRAELSRYAQPITVQAFSALKHTGHEQLLDVLNAWLTDVGSIAVDETIRGK